LYLSFLDALAVVVCFAVMATAQLVLRCINNFMAKYQALMDD